MKKKRREFIQKVSATLVVGLIAVGVSRDGRVMSFLRNLKHRATSPSGSNDQPTSPTASNNRAQQPREELPDEKEYRAFLDGLGLRYFSAAEIIRPHKNYRYGVQNNIPPKRMWKNMERTLWVADELRHRLGVKAQILSAYRSPDYNTAIGGASRSQHMENRALDLRFSCSSSEAVAMAKALQAEDFFTGGIGSYKSFIHIDTRGYNASW